MEHIEILDSDLDTIFIDDDIRDIESAFKDKDFAKARRLITIAIREPGKSERLQRCLLEACFQDDIESIEVLLNADIKPESTTIKLVARKPDLGILQLFLDHGLKLNEALNWCEPPLLHLAIDHPCNVDELLRKGADPNARCTLDLTPLSVAVQSASLEVIEKMFDAGGKFDCGQLLHYACRRSMRDRLEVIELLLDRGCSISSIMYEDHRASYQMQRGLGLGTPLHEAARSGHFDVVQLLVRKGANVQVKDSNECTPQTLAELHGYDEIASYLQQVEAT